MIGNLKSILENNTPANVLTEVAADYVSQIIAGVSYLHGQSIIHTDLRPEHILTLPGAGDESKMLLKVGGLDRPLFANGRVMRLEEDIRSSLPYISPELAALLCHTNASGYKNISPAVDVYSLGVVALELLCGRHETTLHSPDFRYQC